MRAARLSCAATSLTVTLLIALAHATAMAGPATRTAPRLDATLLDGSSFSLAQQRGKVVLVNFWASWCAPCREAMPALDSFHARHRARGLEVIAISLDDPRDLAKVRDLASAYRFPVAMAAQSRHEGFGRIWRLPMTFVIDRTGGLRADLTATVLQVDLPFLEGQVAPLLEQ